MHAANEWRGLFSMQGIAMSQDHRLVRADLSGLRQIKKISGERIRNERRRRNIKQEEFAHQMGISPRWLREIEAGNPGGRLEDHILAGIMLGIPTGYIGLAIECLAQGMNVPTHILYSNTNDLDRQCVELIANAAIQNLKRELAGEWQDGQPL